MKQTVFNALPVISESQIGTISVGNYFLFTDQAWQQNGGVALRYRIQYCRRISDEYPQGIQRNYEYVYDILQSDDLGTETKTATRKKINRSPSRDDDDRNYPYGVQNETDWA